MNSDRQRQANSYWLVLYNFLVQLVVPVFAAHVVRRALADRRAVRGLWESLGWAPRIKGPAIWVHAVSVGEVHAAEPLIRRLLASYPDDRLVVTTATATGAERVRHLFGKQVQHCFVPFDTRFATRRFLRRVRPELAVVMETELWPNLFLACKRAGVPLILGSARISSRAFPSYRRTPVAGVMRHAMACVTAISAQSGEDALRFVALGAHPDRVEVGGNLKFDRALDIPVAAARARLRRSYGGEARPVWVAASTHPGEERIVLAAYKLLRRLHPKLLLLLVPRRPERGYIVARLCRQAGYRVMLRSDAQEDISAPDIVVGDIMGELPVHYAAADAAFIGGSLVSVGGHNLLEPAGLGLTAIVGPYLYNVESIAAALAEADLLRQVADASELANSVATALKLCSKRKQRSQAAEAVIVRHRGATERLMELLQTIYPAPDIQAAQVEGAYAAKSTGAA